VHLQTSSTFPLIVQGNGKRIVSQQLKQCILRSVCQQVHCTVCAKFEVAAGTFTHACTDGHAHLHTSTPAARSIDALVLVQVCAIKLHCQPSNLSTMPKPTCYGT
jgi:hypothetical protein